MSNKKLKSGLADPLETQARELFIKTFGREPEAVAKAPGRVNLIGRADEGVNESTLVSVQSSDKIKFKPGANATEEWGKYAAGVAAQYGLSFPIIAAFASDVPLGGGLSSSAALDVSFATALEKLLDKEKDWDPRERALKCVEGDHTFVGVPCGIMDQFASSCCKEGQAILIDCKTSTGILYPLYDPTICFVVTNTNIKHSHSGGEYGARVRECQEAAKKLGVPYLREISELRLVDAIENEVVRRRARHVVSENERTLKAAKAAQSQEWSLFGQLMNESHESLRADFEVSCPELDFLVREAQQAPGVFGSRMTGGGFGGCIVTLVKRDSAEDLKTLLSNRYKNAMDRTCTSYIFLRPANGATVLT